MHKLIWRIFCLLLLQKYPSEFLVEQLIKSNHERTKSKEQRAKSNEQRAKSKKQQAKVTSNEQKVMSNEQKITSNERKVSPRFIPYRGKKKRA